MRKANKSIRSKSSVNVSVGLMHVLHMFVCVSGQFEVVSPTVNNYRGGMRANYTVEKCSMFQRQAEVMLHSKTYYLAAVETDWDYSPNRTWEAEMFHGLDKYGSTAHFSLIYSKLVKKVSSKY